MDFYCGIYGLNRTQAKQRQAELVELTGLARYRTRSASKLSGGWKQRLAMGTIIPSIFLSGYVFPIDSMPELFKTISYFIPTTWLIDASRGILLRGTDWSILWQHTVVLWLKAIVVTTIAAMRMRKQVV